MGTCEDKGEKAKAMSTAIINTGMNSSINGGGGSGGKSNGSRIRNIAKTINTITDLLLNNLIIKLPTLLLYHH